MHTNKLVTNNMKYINGSNRFFFSGNTKGYILELNSYIIRYMMILLQQMKLRKRIQNIILH